VSDKVLVKQLQKEVARLEAELRIPEGNENCSSDALLHAKDLQIQKVAFLPMLVLFILST
jgi:centromeric protein E